MHVLQKHLRSVTQQLALIWYYLSTAHLTPCSMRGYSVARLAVVTAQSHYSAPPTPLRAAVDVAAVEADRLLGHTLCCGRVPTRLTVVAWWSSGVMNDSITRSCSAFANVSASRARRQANTVTWPRIQTLFLILSKQKIFRYFMHMRAKTICGFARILKSLCDITIFDGSYPTTTFDP